MFSCVQNLPLGREESLFFLAGVECRLKCKTLRPSSAYRCTSHDVLMWADGTAGCFVSVEVSSGDTHLRCKVKALQTHLRQLQVGENFTIDAHTTDGGLGELLDSVLLWGKRGQGGVRMPTPKPAAWPGRAWFEISRERQEVKDRVLGRHWK